MAMFVYQRVIWSPNCVLSDCRVLPAGPLSSSCGKSLWELRRGLGFSDVRVPTTVEHSHLVGGIPTPLKNMKVSWDYYSQYMEK